MCAFFLKQTLTILTTINRFQRAKTFLLLVAFAVVFYAAPQSNHAGVASPNFNAEIETNSFSSKQVNVMVIQPDDKILVSGYFNSFNRQSVSGLIRLTADGLLDPTFNNNLLAAGGTPSNIYVQPDGRILVSGHNLKLYGSDAPLPQLFRLNADGTIDPTFSFFGGSDSAFGAAAVSATGKILIRGNFPQTVNGTTVVKHLVQLNPDGTIDNSFSFSASTSVTLITWQSDKPLIATYVTGTPQPVVLRLALDGSVNSSFTLITSNGFDIQNLIVAPDNKILVLNDQNLRRFNENGSSDTSFQTVSTNGGTSFRHNFHIGSDGRITYARGVNSSSGVQIRRILTNGGADPTFTSYSQVTFGAFAVQSDGEIFVGDQTNSPIGISNQYTHLFANGTVDTAFNTGGFGFQTINPGKISAIAVQPDQKIIVAGKFDLIKNVNRSNIARLNMDNTVDDSFQIKTSAPGNYFSQINEFYSVRIEPNGKIIVTGSFNYILNGSAKVNVVRLNVDGSMDPTFNIGANINNYFDIALSAGKIKTATQNDGKLVIATARNGTGDTTKTPNRFNADGSIDLTFNPTLYNAFIGVYTHEVAVQPDQKILFSGVISNGGNLTGFIARLNSDGSPDESFQRIEETGKVIGAFNLLADGKIFIVKASGNYYTTSQSVVSRLNANGTEDATFAVGAGANGVINAMLVMPNGQILLGGKFTTYNGEDRQYMVLLNADGSLAPIIYKVSGEVFSLAIDNKGRVITDVSFSVIKGGEQN